MNKKKTTLNTILIIIFSIIFGGALYYQDNYTLEKFDNIFSTLFGSNQGASPDVILTNLRIFAPYFLAVFILTFLMISTSDKAKYFFGLVFDEENRISKIRNKITKHANLIAGLLIVFAILFFGSVINFGTFLLSNINSSTIYQDEYVDPRDVEITFPEDKKNLIHIYLESMENSTFSHKNGGDQLQSVTPELEELALEGVNFSFTQGIGGFQPLPGTDWTQAALIAQESAINYKSLYATEENFKYSLPNVVSRGDVLKENGYNLHFLMGSDADFANRETFFETHGYEIYDLKKARADGSIPENYHVWWGFEDKKLFEYAKEQVTEIANKNQPFAFNILTVDTHFTDGYMDAVCEMPFEDKYLNAYACSSKKVGEFVDWLKDQDFYKDTVVVITGDHLTMQSDIFNQENRYVYNTILNSDKKPIQSKNRQTTTLDIFPTVLSAMNVEIEGKRLGLGVDLFSDQQTLAEKYGLIEFSEEVYKDDDSYWSIIMGDVEK